MLGQFNMSIKCLQCHFVRPDNTDSACPECGNKEGMIIQIINENSGIREEHIVQKTHVKSNRSTKIIDSSLPTDFHKLNQLVRDFVERESKELEMFIDTLVQNFDKRLAFPELELYRGVDVSVKENICTSYIGPSPNPSDGRYNSVGVPCLYLIDNRDFLPNELNSSHLLVQNYRVPMFDNKIANISPRNRSLNNSLNIVFDFSERGDTGTGYAHERELLRKGKSRYLLSQLLATVFKRHDWDGLYIPGVHGNEGQHYHNIVIFDPAVRKWESWTRCDHYEIRFP